MIWCMTFMLRTLVCGRKKNSSINTCCQGISMPWNMFFPFDIWSLWLHRNKIVFKSSPPNHELGREVCAIANEYCASWSKWVKRKQVVKVRWNKPEVGWFKLNTFGSSLGNRGFTSGGGLVRDHNGFWIKGFTHSIGVFTSVDAELWALREGLLLCTSLNFVDMEIELDAKVVLGWISNEYNNSLHHASLIIDCRTLISQFLKRR